MSDKPLIDWKDTKENSKAMSQKSISEVSSITPSDSSNNLGTDQMSLSFAGCGFLSFYYLGVGACLRQYSQINEKTIICGASSGIMAGLALILDISLDKSIAQILDVALKVGAKPLGIAQPSCDLHKMIYDGLTNLLSDDSHLKASGRLYISVTRVSDGKNVLISQYDSKEDLIRAIQCSSFMPFLSGMSPPKYKGIAYIDGALSNNAPKISGNTITVSPWTGEFDICPINDSSLPLQVMFYNKLISLSPSNLYRMTQIAFPPSSEVKTIMCQQGYDDTLRFLLRSNKIWCIRCLSTEPLFPSFEDLEEDKLSGDSGYFNTPSKDERHSHNLNINCKDCKKRREIAVNDSIPEAIVQAIEEGCHKVNQSIINKMCGHRPIKLLMFLVIPFLLLFELIIAVVLGIFTNDWTSEVFADILNVSKIMITNGLTGRDQKSIFL